MGERPIYYQDVEKCVDDLIAKVGKKIVIAFPLALAKPNRLANSLYQRAKNDSGINLTFLTGVSLERPVGASELEKRFLGPFGKRVWKDFEDYEYILDIRANKIPKNFRLMEFYNKTAAFLHTPHVQQNYIGSNYTHAVRDAVINECNALGQLIATRQVNGKIEYSMGSNPDTHLEATANIRKLIEDGKYKKKFAVIGQTHSQMPFMKGKAVVEGSHFDMIIDNRDYDKQLFCAPKLSVGTVDWMIGIHASALVKDGGTMQIGIGSLGDAVAAACLMRHKNNKDYNDFLDESEINSKFGDIIDEVGGRNIFDKGLLCSSEMFVDTFLNLFKEGIVKRKVYEHAGLQKLLNDNKIKEKFDNQILNTLVEEKIIHKNITKKDFDFLTYFGILEENLKYENRKIYKDDKAYDVNLNDEQNLSLILKELLGKELKNGVVAYASFFIGPENFYQGLRDLTEEERSLIDMRGVDYVNQLYGDEEIKRLQRTHGRFINAGIKVNAVGAVTADGLENHKVISGPGGQYNFVSMAHALVDARAITMIKSVRGFGKNAKSNIVWQYGHITVPRHLKDIIITEYGIADLRGRDDKDTIARLLNVTDSRFQEELLKKAKKYKKIDADYQIPKKFKNNYPEALEKKLKNFREKGFFKVFPFGTDLTEEEKIIGKALKGLKAAASENVPKLVAAVLKELVLKVPSSLEPYLKRMGLESPNSLKERLLQKVVVYALKKSMAK